MSDVLPDLEPVMLRGLTWPQALAGLEAVDCAIRREHWCSPVVILRDGNPVLDDDGEIKPFTFMRGSQGFKGDRWADDWMMVPRFDDEGEQVRPTYRARTLASGGTSDV